MQLSDPIHHLLAQPPGSSIWAPLAYRPGAPLEPAICARLESGEAARIPAGATVEHRAGCIVQDGIGLVAWLCQIDGRQEWTFETWINVHSTDPGPLKNPLPVLRQQTHLLVHLFETSERPARSMRVTNRLDWASIEAALPPSSWSMQDFDQGREHVYARFPDVSDLWAALGLHQPASTPTPSDPIQ